MPLTAFFQLCTLQIPDVGPSTDVLLDLAVPGWVPAALHRVSEQLCPPVPQLCNILTQCHVYRDGRDASLPYNVAHLQYSGTTPFLYITKSLYIHCFVLSFQCWCSSGFCSSCFGSFSPTSSVVAPSSNGPKMSLRFADSYVDCSAHAKLQPAPRRQTLSSAHWVPQTTHHPLLHRGLHLRKHLGHSRQPLRRDTGTTLRNLWTYHSSCHL